MAAPEPAAIPENKVDEFLVFLDNQKKQAREQAKVSGDWYWDETKRVVKPEKIVVYEQLRKVDKHSGKRISKPASDGGTRKQEIEIAHA